MTRALLSPLILIVAACAMAFMLLANIVSPMRAIFSLAFFLVCPGMALVQLLNIEDWIAQLTLALALSIALSTIVSEAMIYADSWSPVTAGLGFIALTLLASLIQLTRVLFTMRSAYASTHSRKHTRKNA